MKSRRDFIGDVGKGILSTIIIPTLGNSNDSAHPLEEKQGIIKERIRIGIIGAENSHTAALASLFNVEKKFPGIEVQYVWGETDEFAKNAAKKGLIPNVVKNPLEMMGKIDALIVDHRHPKYHLEAALPFIKERIPTFIDKPFCYRVAEGKEFFKIAQELKTPVTSYGTISQTDEVFDMKEQVPYIENLLHIICSGPSDVESINGGIFFYGVHTLEKIMNIFGDDVQKVRVTSHRDKTIAVVVFESGYIATIYFIKKDFHRHDIMLLTYYKDYYESLKHKHFVPLEPRIKESDGLRPYRDMVEMFRTGKEPKSHDSILKCMGVLEALEKSVLSQQWENVVV
jgi:predicted dehydrogenase